MAERRTESPTHTAREARAAAENALVEVLATWGGAAQAEIADLLQVIGAFQSASEILRELCLQDRDWLPAALRDEIERIVAIMGSGESLGAPSFRTRVDQVLARTREALEPRIAERRAALSERLGSWALLLDQDQLDRTLRCLWRSERSAGVADQIAVMTDLQQAQSILAASRQSVASEIGRRIAALPAGAAGADILERAREALGGEDPLALLRSKLALEALQSRQGRGAAQDRLAQARTRLASLCDGARQKTSGDLRNGGAARVRSAAVAGAERALQASTDGAGGAVDFEPVLAGWESALRSILEADAPGAVGGGGERERLVRTFRAEMEPFAPPDRSQEDPGQAEMSREAAAIEAILREGAPAGGRTFQEALDRAVGLLRKVRHRAASRLEESAARLRAAGRDLAAFLEKASDQLPTARVVQARLWLEQVEGILASRDQAGVESLARAIQEDLERLSELAAHVQRRRTNREEAEREALRSEAARLADASPRGPARRLEALVAEAERCDARQLPRLRDQLERVRNSIEQTIRLEAGRVSRGADRFLRRKAGRAAGRHPERAQAVARGLEALNAASEKSDLAALRERAAELRSSLRAVAPAARPWVRFTLAAAALGALAAVPVTLHYLWSRPQTFLLRLDAPPPKPVRVWMVRDGRIVGDEEYGAADDGVRFSLTPGRYEVFVNERYTGRVIRIPGETEATGIPLPPG